MFFRQRPGTGLTFLSAPNDPVESLGLPDLDLTCGPKGRALRVPLPSSKKAQEAARRALAERNRVYFDEGYISPKSEGSGSHRYC